MRRCGSTLLWNMAVSAYEMLGADVHATFTKYFVPRGASVEIVKVHFGDDMLAASADVVLTARRDLREVVASVKRRVVDESHGDTVDNIALANVAFHTYWYTHSTHEFVYEQWQRDRHGEARRVLDALGIVSIHPAELIRHTRKRMSTPNYDYNLLMPDHETGDTQDHIDTLTEEEVVSVNTKYGWWLRRYGYAV
jgi:hypothetical protein